MEKEPFTLNLALEGAREQDIEIISFAWSTDGGN